MTRCETSRLGAIPRLVPSLPQRLLHGNAKTFDVIFKKMGEESTRVVELTLGVVIVVYFWSEIQF